MIRSKEHHMTLTREKYDALVLALLTGSADEHDQENAIKITLGEMLDLWPESLKAENLP
jgi:hypothetical protein